MADEQALQERVHALEKEIRRLSAQMKSEKYGLRWVECPEAFEEESESKIPILAEVPERAVRSDDGKPTHVLIEGDNYHALTCLNFTHRGKIDVIYIDPPYNTGSDGFTYRDRRFLERYPDGEVIGKDHPLRHSAWLSFMSKRLRLAKGLLRDSGVIFISIDDNEMANLRILCDSIFGEKNFLGNIAWESKTKSQNTTSAFDKLQPKVEHILVYAKTGQNHFNLVKIGERKYDKSDEKGKYREYEIEVMDADGVRGRETMVFPVKGVNPPEGQQWKLGKATISDYEKRGDLFLKDGWPCVKIRPSDERNDVSEPFWGFIPKNIGTAESAKKELKAIIGPHDFETVKPVALIQKLIFHASNKKSSVILDFFAGSGTTLEATARLNMTDGGARQCIVCTDNEAGICERITYARVKNVLQGFTAYGNVKTVLFKKKLEMSDLTNASKLLDEMKKIVADNRAKYSSVQKDIVDGDVIISGVIKKKHKVPPLGGSLKYYRTAFVGKRRCTEALDEDRSALAAKAGALLALAEETLEEVPLSAKEAKRWQRFTDGARRHTLVYFSDDLDGFASLAETADAIRAADGAARVTVYVYATGCVDAFENEFDDLSRLSLKPIPEPILEIYKAINAR